MSIDTISKSRALAKVFALAKDEREIRGLLDDLFSEAELRKAYERTRMYDCLSSGFTQRETQARTGVAIATVSRGAQYLKKSSQSIRQILMIARKNHWWKTHFWPR